MRYDLKSPEYLLIFGAFLLNLGFKKISSQNENAKIALLTPPSSVEKDKRQILCVIH